MSDDWAKLNGRIARCRRCERLIGHCRATAVAKRASFRDWTYWGKPVPNFGDPSGRLLIVGLAPAAHGANRTGRMFTGDRSGGVLYDALHRAGFANQPTAESRDDGLALRDCAITAVAHCAPPANKPTRGELDACTPWLEATFDLMERLRVIVCLGRLAHDEVMRRYRRRGTVGRLADHRFGHGAVHRLGDPVEVVVIDSFHPSPQNTFTGRLTTAMLVDVFESARRRL